jgi:carbon storage regulator
MLCLSRKPEESILIGGGIEVKILSVRGDTVRLGIQAPPEVPVHRRKVAEAIQRNESRQNDA